MSVILCVAVACAIPAAVQAQEDVERALAAVRVNAERGDAVAQFSLGAILYYERTDTAEAVEWIRKAASQGHAAAEFHLGQIYDFGLAPEPASLTTGRDPNREPMPDASQGATEALKWYRRAADHGSAAAQRAVGDFHLKGRGVPPDAAEAARWYRRAAEADDIRAQYQLAELYFNGTGVTRDYASAYFWYAIAAGQAPLEDNRKGLLELRNIAAARMTPEQTTEAARRVAEWKPLSR